MEDIYPDLNVEIYTTDHEKAQAYNFKSATNVLLNETLLPIDIVTDQTKMDEFLSKQLKAGL